MTVTATKPSKFRKKQCKDWCVISFHACPETYLENIKITKKKKYSMHVLRHAWNFFQQSKKKNTTYVHRTSVVYFFAKKIKSSKESSAQVFGTCLVLYPYLWSPFSGGWGGGGPAQPPKTIYRGEGATKTSKIRQNTANNPTWRFNRGGAPPPPNMK